MSVLNDYDMLFFVEHHAARCPVTGQPAAIVAISEEKPYELFRSDEPIASYKVPNRKGS